MKHPFSSILISIVSVGVFLTPDANAEVKLDSRAEAYASQAKKCLGRGELRKAANLYEEAIQQEVEDANDQLYKAVLYNNLGECYRRMAEDPAQMSSGDDKYSCLQKAATNIEESLRIKEEKSSASTNFIYIALSLENLAAIYKQMNKTDQAEALYHKAIAIRQEKEGKNTPSCASAYLSIGDMLTTDRHFNDAHDALKRALALYSSSCKPTDNVLGVCHQKLAYLYFLWDKITLAGDEYDKAISIFNQNPTTAKRYQANLERNIPDFPKISYGEAWSLFDAVKDKPKSIQRPQILNMIKALKRAKVPTNEIQQWQNLLN